MTEDEASNFAEEFTMDNINETMLEAPELDFVKINDAMFADF
jgi:hypothetical protein